VTVRSFQSISFKTVVLLTSLQCFSFHVCSSCVYRIWNLTTSIPLTPLNASTRLSN
jgi:hypothetical protein